MGEKSGVGGVLSISPILYAGRRKWIGRLPCPNVVSERRAASGEANETLPLDPFHPTPRTYFMEHTVPANAKEKKSP